MAGGQLARLSDLPPGSAQPSISPDGRHIAVSTAARDSRELWMMENLASAERYATLMSRSLIVEDDPAILCGLKDNLEFESHQVLTAADGEAGYRSLCEHVRPTSPLG